LDKGTQIKTNNPKNFRSVNQTKPVTCDSLPHPEEAQRAIEGRLFRQ